MSEETQNQATTGRCLCGAVTYQYQGPPLWTGHCHCESCRRHTSSAFASYIGVAENRFQWTGTPPQVFHSTEGVRRRFCGACGSPMSYEADRFPGEVHLFAPTLDNPNDYEPGFHVFTSEQLAWVHIVDDLPRHKTVSFADDD